MARKQKGNHSFKFFYNVSQHVGPRLSNPNNPDDVELVQFLVLKVMSKIGGGNALSLGLPRLTRSFDAVTGFWIFRLQADTGSITIDGIVSPAKSDGLYGPNSAWVIIRLNHFFKLHFPSEFENLPDNPLLSISLRNSIR